MAGWLEYKGATFESCSFGREGASTRSRCLPRDDFVPSRRSIWANQSDPKIGRIHPGNIAEGSGRGGNELPRFCRIAVGSASELQYHLLLAHDLGMLNDSTYGRLRPKRMKSNECFPSSSSG
jgi:hypothetical protein